MELDEAPRQVGRGKAHREVQLQVICRARALRVSLGGCCILGHYHKQGAGLFNEACSCTLHRAGVHQGILLWCNGAACTPHAAVHTGLALGDAWVQQCQHSATWLTPGPACSFRPLRHIAVPSCEPPALYQPLLIVSSKTEPHTVATYFAMVNIKLGKASCAWPASYHSPLTQLTAVRRTLAWLVATIAA